MRRVPCCFHKCACEVLQRRAKCASSEGLPKLPFSGRAAEPSRQDRGPERTEGENEGNAGGCFIFLAGLCIPLCISAFKSDCIVPPLSCSPAALPCGRGFSP